ncbi:VOC family protein [Gordonia caeni]|uniref:VOC domain-containing protein n=1 Tax=Gordonia caeni TaxID=1007097 RepID=A0ABP7PKB5_9ACTN
MAPDPLQLSDVAVTVEATDRPATAAAYTALLGPADSVTGRWSAGNGAIAAADAGDGAAGVSAAFQVADPDGAARLLARRGSAVTGHGGVRWFDAAPAVGITGAAGARPGAPLLDHIVFTAPSVDVAIALFAGRLGANLRLVRTFGEVHQVFFRTSTVVIEVLAGADGAGPGIEVWGLAWRCPDLDAEHRRLTGAGLPVSDIRAGRKPGTRVATIREPALGTPTILLEQTEP